MLCASKDKVESCKDNPLTLSSVKTVNAATLQHTISDKELIVNMILTRAIFEVTGINV